MLEWHCHRNFGLKKRSYLVPRPSELGLGSGDDMSTSECLGTSVMSRYGGIRSGSDLPDQNFHWAEISVLTIRSYSMTQAAPTPTPPPPPSSLEVTLLPTSWV